MQGVAACRVERGASSSICQRYSAAASGPAVAVAMAPRNQRMHSLRRKREHAESYVMPRLSMLSSPRCASPERGHRVRAEQHTVGCMVRENFVTYQATYTLAGAW